MMILRLIALGLATAIRPTSLAAVGALLAQPSPRRFLTAYVVAGAGFTVAFGIAVIAVFHGVEFSPSSGRVRAVAEIIAGGAAVVFGLLLVSGRVGAHRIERDQPVERRGWISTLSEHLSVRKAAVAGPMTHIPGVLYLLALDLIVTEQRTTELGVVDLLIFNGLWFALPIAALTLSIIRPGSGSRAIAAARPWIERYGRTVLIIVLLTVGGAFLVHGLRTV